jgi:hypothetical protein
MNRKMLIAAAATSLIATGCYRASVQTGLQPAPQVIERQWAHGYLWGLVGPNPVKAGVECPTGIAEVETRLSIANQLASYFTIGLYTPMTIRTVCAVPRD